MSSEALNLEVIAAAIRKHDDSCPWELVEIRMAPYEVDRLGWDEFQGIPIVEDETMGTGRFRLVCENDPAPVEGLEVGEQKAIPA